MPGRAGHIPASREPARIGPLTVCAARGLRLVAAMPPMGWWSMDSRFRSRPAIRAAIRFLSQRSADGGRLVTPARVDLVGKRRLPVVGEDVFQRRPDNKGGAVTWAIATNTYGPWTVSLSQAASAAAEDHGPASCLPVQTDRGHDGSVQSKRGTVRVGLVAELN